MDEEMINVCLQDEPMSFNMDLPKSVVERMVQIREQEPDKWKSDLDLLHEAQRQLKEQSQQPQNPSEQ